LAVQWDRHLAGPLRSDRQDACPTKKPKIRDRTSEMVYLVTVSAESFTMTNSERRSNRLRACDVTYVSRCDRRALIRTSLRDDSLVDYESVAISLLPN